MAATVIHATGDWHSIAERFPPGTNAKTRNEDIAAQVEIMCERARRDRRKRPKDRIVGVLLGDLAHVNKPPPSVVAFLEDQLGLMLEVYNELHVILGNHEANDAEEDALATLEGRLHTARLTVHRDVEHDQVGDTPVVWLPHLTRKVLKCRPSASYDEAVSAYLAEKQLVRERGPGLAWGSIVFGHGTWPGAKAGSEERMVPGGVMALPSLACRLAVMGHIHRPQDIGDNVRLAGSPVCVDFAERLEKKRFLVIRDGAVTSVPLDPQPYVQVELDYTGDGEEMPKEEAVSGAVVKVVVKTTQARRGSVPMAEIVGEINKRGYVRQQKLEVVDRDDARERKAEETPGRLDLTPLTATKKWLKAADAEEGTKRAAYRVAKKALAETAPPPPPVEGAAAVRPTRLKIKNLFNIRKADIHLPNGVLGVLGRWASDPASSNGAGKSGVLKALYLAWTGENPDEGDTANDAANDVTKEPSEVKMRLSCGGGKYATVTRGRNAWGADGKRRSAARAYAQLTFKGADGPAATGDTEVTKALEALTGATAQTLAQTSFFFEAFQDEFLRAKPAARKQWLQRFFGMEHYERARAKAMKAKGEADREAAATNGALSLLGKQRDLNVKAARARAKALAREEKAKTEEAVRLREEIEQEARLAERAEHAKELRDAAKAAAEALAEALASVEELKTAATDRAGKLEKLRALETDVVAKERANQKAVQAHATAKAAAETLRARVEEMSALDGEVTCPTCAQALDPAAVAGMLAQVRAESKAATTGAEATFRVQAEAWDALTAARQAKTRAERAVPADPAARLAKLADRIPKLKARKAKAAKAAKAATEAKAANVQDLKTQAHLAELAAREATRQLAETKTAIEEHGRWKKKVAELTKKHEAQKAAVEAAALACRALDRNGAPSAATSAIVREVEARANDNLGRLTERGDKLVIELENFQRTKTDAVREGVDILVRFDGGERRRYTSYSGGERGLINFALRMGMAQTLSDLVEFRAAFLALDEVMKQMDPPNRAAMLRILDYVKRRFGQVLVVTHTALKDQLPATVTMVRGYDRTSTVEGG